MWSQENEMSHLPNESFGALPWDSSYEWKDDVIIVRKDKNSAKRHANTK